MSLSDCAALKLTEKGKNYIVKSRGDVPTVLKLVTLMRGPKIFILTHFRCNRPDLPYGSATELKYYLTAGTKNTRRI